MTDLNTTSPCVQFEDNNIHSKNGWLPCEPYHKGGPIVSCCKSDSECLDFGLCHYNHSLVGGSGYYQGSCTDAKYTNDLCPHLCNDQLYPDVVYNTSLKEWQCCGANSDSEVSCNAPTTNEFFDAPVPSLLSTTATPGQTTRARGTKTRTRKPATGTRNLTITPATSAPAASSGLSTGAKAGIGVGAALGAIAIIGLIAWFLLRRRKGKKDKPAGKPPEGQPTQQDYKYGQGYQGHTQPMFAHPVEADSTQMAELPQPGLESYADNMYGPKMNPSSNQQYPQELPTNPPGHLSPRPWSG